MTDSSGAPAGAKTVPTHLVGCAVTGPKHEGPDEQCEDAWAGERLDDSRAVIAVADGLGTASLSHRGSALATEVVTSELTAALEAIDSPTPQQLERLLFACFNSARAALSVEADARGVDVSELNTTLLAGVTTADHVAGAAVGDGGLVYRTDESTELLVPREGLEYANETRPLPSSDWRDSYRFGVADGASAIAAFSDGLHTFAWGGPNSVQDVVFDQVFTLVGETDDSALIESELASFLDADRFREQCRDDKTIAIATTTGGGRDPTSASGVDVDQPSRATTTAEPTATQSDPATTKAQPSSRSTEAGGTVDPSGATAATTRTATAAGAGTQADDRPTPTSEERTTSTRAGTGTESVQTTPVDELEGTSLATDAGDEIELAALLDSGPGYCQYATAGGDSRVVTVYRPEWRTDALEARVDALLGRTPPTDQYVDGVTIEYQWPTAAVTAPTDDTVIGYTLPWAEPGTSADLLEFARWDRERSTVRHRLESLLSGRAGPDRHGPAVAQEVAAVVARLHSRGITLGAFSHERIRVGEESLYVLTGDHSHVAAGGTVHHGASPRGRYQPPEPVEGDLSALEHSDQFALGVHLYRLLMGGHSPFEASRGDDDSRTLKRHLRPGASGRLTVRSSEAATYDDLPELVRFHLERCFRAGWDTPERRPTADEWSAILTRSLR